MDMEYWSLKKYSPRPEQMKIIDRISFAMDEGYKNIILEAGTGIGKALALDTKIPTPFGFTTMGDLKVGDEVFDECGTVCHVLTKSKIFRNHDCYEISFVQGGTVIADANHEWRVQTAKDRKRNKGEYTTLTTEEMAKSVFTNQDNRKNYSIDVCMPLDLDDKKLPINPYLLGLWLGDGSSTKSEITTADKEVLKYFKKDGWKIMKHWREYHYCICGGFLKLLEENNLLGNKHIPEIYLRASYNQRLALIQGLMDSDGHITKQGICEITFKNKDLICGLKELLCSIGIKTSIKEVYKKASNSNQEPTKYYNLTFTTLIPVFRLQRHLDRLPNKLRSTQYKRYIKSIKKVESIPTQCITVDSPSHLFLCTDDFIPTHNSAIATTIARMVDDSYILTMTNQLQSQYLHDFHYMLSEIKGRNNYVCNYGGYCNNCQMEKEEEKRCSDCEYLMTLQDAQNRTCVITNYDYLFYSGNYANQWDARDLIILDEAHNFEKKIMSLVSEELNRYLIYERYGFDIFESVAKRGALKAIDNTEYWANIVEKCIMKEHEVPLFDASDEKKQKANLAKYSRMLQKLRADDYVIELPMRKDILADKDKDNRLKVELKPLSGANHSDNLLKFGKTRLFLTGTLGNKEKFCEWNGLNVDETCYIYVKSPFPVENRPIIRKYVCSMKQEAWKNPHIIKYIRRILDEHAGEKGVIHTSSNAQAWWIKKLLNSNRVWVAYGNSREASIKSFEESAYPITLVGAGLKDGVDFKGDKCRYQILFKVPFPSLGSRQVTRRREIDPTWYAYQTVMSLMQSYGRGIRDIDDYCKYYVLDEDFERLIHEYDYLFNEYFIEAIQ